MNEKKWNTFSQSLPSHFDLNIKDIYVVSSIIFLETECSHFIILSLPWNVKNASLDHRKNIYKILLIYEIFGCTISQKDSQCSQWEHLDSKSFIHHCRKYIYHWTNLVSVIPSSFLVFQNERYKDAHFNWYSVHLINIIFLSVHNVVFSTQLLTQMAYVQKPCMTLY